METKIATHTYWEKGHEPLATKPLVGATKTEVCVIGAGIAGLTTAYFLAKDGQKVTVLEKGHIGGGETSRTSAHLSNVLEERYFKLQSIHGAEGTKMIAESHTEAMRTIEEIAKTENIDCDLEHVPGHLFLGSSHDIDYLRREFKAVTKAGIPVDWVDESPLPHLAVGPWIRFRDQLQFHPMKYLLGLARAVQKLGVEIYTDTMVTEINGETAIELTTANGSMVLAEQIVMATNTPSLNWVAMHTKQAAYRTYVIGIEVAEESLQKGLYWDTENPYHYLRFIEDDRGQKILLIGGEDHKTGQLADGEHPWKRLEVWARRHIAGLGPVRFHWSGQVEESNDGLGFAGMNPGVHRNRFVITGDSGNGLTNGTIGAKIVSDLIAARRNNYTELYSPGRVRVMSSDEFVRENANTLLQYKDFFKRAPKGTEHIAREEGKVIREKGEKVAAYRDAGGVMHKCTAICPHMGAVLRWNALEKSWDCPAHGSRFSAEGALLNGPANCDLKPIESKEKVSVPAKEKPTPELQNEVPPTKTKKPTSEPRYL